MNCFDGVSLLDDESIDCVITSPPYWALRDYEKNEEQFGLEETADEYVEKLILLFDEIHRILKPTGTCWVNIGDTYSGSGKGLWNSGDYRKESFKFDKKPAVKDDVMKKSLTMIPERFALSMIRSKKWALRNQIIWHKPNVKPENVDDRYTNDFEKLFFFVKDRQYNFKKQTETGANGKERNKRAVWSIHTGQYQGAHTAVFPPELLHGPIDAGCPVDGVVFDPFMGSGTTAAVAKQLGRDFIGFELNPEYINLAEKRLADVEKESKTKSHVDGIFK